MLLKLLCVCVCVQSMYAVAWRRYRVHHSDGLEHRCTVNVLESTKNGVWRIKDSRRTQKKSLHVAVLSLG